MDPACLNPTSSFSLLCTPHPFINRIVSMAKIASVHYYCRLGSLRCLLLKVSSGSHAWETLLGGDCQVPPCESFHPSTKQWGEEWAWNRRRSRTNMCGLSLPNLEVCIRGHVWCSHTHSGRLPPRGENIASDIHRNPFPLYSPSTS